MNLQSILNEIEHNVIASNLSGEVASYIPELAHVSPDKFGFHLCSIDGSSGGFGDCEEKFSIQSISKVLLLTLALELEGESLWERVHVEPSGDPFNSLVQLEYENGIPRNPLINPGALVVCDILVSHLKNPKEDYLEFVRSISNPDINYDEKVAASELAYGYHNKAMVNLMKGYGNINNHIDDILDLYVHSCS